MPPRKHKDPPLGVGTRKRTRSETAKSTPDSSGSGEPVAKRPRGRPRMRPIPPPSPDIPSINPKDKRPIEAGSSSRQPDQRHSVHWSADTKPGDDTNVEEMISDLLSSDPEPEPEPKVEVDELEYNDSFPPPDYIPKKITLRLGSKAENSNRETRRENSPQLNDYGVNVVYESPDKLAFTTYKDGIKQRTIGIPDNIKYIDFCMRVANEYQVAAHGMDLIYKTSRMAKSDSWCSLASSEDFDAILQEAHTSIVSDAERHRLAIVKNAADGNAARKRGREHVPKPVAPVRQFVISIRDQNYEKNAKALGSKKEKKPKLEPMEGKAAPDWTDLAKRIIEYEKQLLAQKCEICGKCCVLIPVPGQPPMHKELTRANISLWAQLAAKSPDVSLTSPPPELRLLYSDNPPSRRKAKTPATNEPTPGAPGAGPSTQGGNIQVPPLHAGPVMPFPPPNPYLPYYPPAPPAPPIPYGYYGGYPSPYAGYPPVYPGALGHPPAVGGGPNMPLSGWLSACDRGPRGENHDNFSGLLAGLTAKNLYSLSDLRGKPEEYFLSIDFPTTPGGPTFQIRPETAARLVQYVNADLPSF